MILAVAAFYYTKVENSLWVEDKQMLLATNSDPAYGAFLNQLQKECPYYEPNGARYRGCLTNLLLERGNEVNEYYDNLIADLRANVDPEFLTARETFTDHLAKLNRTWLTYRDQFCMAQADQYWGGSNQGGFYNTCRLYETEKYRLLLEGFREEWI